ncbi:hypothetical protein [Magnetofaba australis]|uniref:hypothetical protein n=1 Tax=Magnetofaba australis TaxID=1472297 RepID=UPI0011807D9F|nr:hypothetical protein [Magnetofaba australis]
MPLTDLNATLAEGEKLTLVGPGNVEFTAAPPAKPAAAKTAPIKAAQPAAKGVAAPPAQPIVDPATAPAAKGVAAAATGGTIFKGTGLSLGLGLGLGAWGPALAGAAIIGGGYYLYRRKRIKTSLWPF